MGEGARIIAKYGLKVKNVQDPMSRCFAFSRHIVKDINFEGKGKEALLEILVKINNNKNSNIAVKEIPIKHQDTTITKKINLIYSMIRSLDSNIWCIVRFILWLWNSFPQLCQGGYYVFHQREYLNPIFLHIIRQD